MSDSHDEPPVDLIGYEKRVQDALRGMVRGVLERYAREVPPGGHHFYLTFRTDQSDVPADLLSKYPREITVVIQHQYWDLACTDDGFSVTLKFSGLPRKMVVPWSALTRFYDPSVQFLLQWDPVDEIPASDPVQDVEPDAAPAAEGVVSLAAFRKPKR